MDDLRAATVPPSLANQTLINKALAQIEKQNNMQPGQLEQVLKSHGIERGALIDQLTASIVWTKLVRRLVSQTSVVSEEEIDYALKRAKETANEPQSRVAEIFLAVDNPQQDGDVRRLAERPANLAFFLRSLRSDR